ncbi:MAG: hypothetical protein NZ920_06340 [Aigarchaeota archaeon]|nr:hypothetical protein [Aigarchaeota archaeon]MDW8092726.1 formyltransferase family protein [Nitrososphaerota archaeon]
MPETKIAVFASGRGSNFKSILDHVRLGVLRNCEVRLLVTNEASAGALSIAREYSVPHAYMDHRGVSLYEYEQKVLERLREMEIDLLVMAGWNWMVGRTLSSSYEWRIMAIHPSLHPAFMGPLLSPEEVYAQVLRSGVKVTGCTVYYVSANVDMGPIVLQSAVEIPSRVYDLYLRDARSAVESLREIVSKREHITLPKAIQLHVDGMIELRRLDGGYHAIVRSDERWDEDWEGRQAIYKRFAGLVDQERDPV